TVTFTVLTSGPPMTPPVSSPAMPGSTTIPWSTGIGIGTWMSLPGTRMTMGPPRSMATPPLTSFATTCPSGAARKIAPAARNEMAVPEPSTAMTIRARRMSAARRRRGGSGSDGQETQPDAVPDDQDQERDHPKADPEEHGHRARGRIHLRVLERRQAALAQRTAPARGL